MTKILKKFAWWSAVFGIALATVILTTRAVAQGQDQQDDPPGRVARLGYMQGSVSFQPAGETDWVQAVPNRPMTTGDQLWTDQDSRAEVQLGSAVIRLAANTGFSFLNLNDDTVQIQLTSGAINITVRQLGNDDNFEVDTPNQAFSIFRPGRYRVEASADGSYTVISVRSGEGEATGNGQSFALHGGQRGIFNGTDRLYAEVVDIGGPDDFDRWSYDRDRRYEHSRSAQYLSQDVVGYEDLDEYGDWRDDPNYGHVWYPNQVAFGWAPYRDGHWAWIAPWGWTWVDDSPWGYAPYHYGRWVNVGGRWGWVAGPVAVRAVYAPALVVFIGGGPGGFGGNVGWFPLGPREVYVPSYHVSREYVNRVNISNTTVNTVQITNVYNTTIINRSTNITNVTYANRNVRGAVTAVPQRAFVSAQPVSRAAVTMNERQIAGASVNVRVAVAPTRESVFGSRAESVNRVTAPPPAVMNRQVIAKTPPPPPPVPFARQQQALEAHPGQPLERSEVRSLRPANTEAAHPMVRQAPPGKPATPNVGRPGNQPWNQPNAGRPERPTFTPPASQPENRPSNQQAPSQPNNRPETNRPPSAQPTNRPSQPNNQPEPTRPQPNRPTEPPARNDRQPTAQPNQPAPSQPSNRPETNRPPTALPTNRPSQPSNQPAATRPQTNRPTEPPARDNRQPAAQPSNRPETARPAPSQPEPNRNQPAPQPQTPAPTERQQQRTSPTPAPAATKPAPPPPAAAKPAPPPQRQQPKAQTPAEKKQEEERQKREQQKPPGE